MQRGVLVIIAGFDIRPVFQQHINAIQIPILYREMQRRPSCEGYRCGIRTVFQEQGRNAFRASHPGRQMQCRCTCSIPLLRIHPVLQKQFQCFFLSIECGQMQRSPVFKPIQGINPGPMFQQYPYDIRVTAPRRHVEWRHTVLVPAVHRRPLFA